MAKIGLEIACFAVSACCIFGGSSLADGTRTVINGNVRFQALTPTLVRMEFSPTARFVDEPSVAAINRDDWPAASLSGKTRDGWLTMSTGKMTLRYKIDSGAFSPENLSITWQDNKGSHSWKPGDVDDKNLGGVPASMDNRSTQKVTDPGPLSRKGCYLLDDSKSALFDKASDWVKPRPEKDTRDWYFIIYGSDYAQALGELTRLLGPVPMVPRYIFGSWFGSRASYSGEQWEMIVKQFRDESLPLDILVLDSCTRGKVIWAGYDWDDEQIPDLKGWFKWMKERGVRVTGNEHYGPLTRDNDVHFDEIRKAMGLPADTASINHDIGNKKYAQLFMDLLHKPSLDAGMAFWWQDGAAGTNMEGLEPYLWTRHIEVTGSERITGQRSYAFCRLGPAWGSHRYGGYFTGDLHGQWESLPVLVPATVQGGNMLVPYLNNLCCGVFNADIPIELYQRWVQFGSLSPIIWFHGFWGLRLPWEYGSEGVETYRKFVSLRYALIPYLYTTARIAHETGLPLVRGMYIEYPDQESAYEFEQQYMLGKDLLVAPIIEPTKGKSAPRKVWLPAGNDWFDYFTGDIYTGGQIITHESPIDRMPLFARAGSIIPMAPKMDYSDQKPLDPLTLDVYAGEKPSEFKLYEDDGLSLEYKNGACSWTEITLKPADGSGSCSLTIGPSRGKFKGQLKKRGYIVQVHGLLKPDAVTVNGKKIALLGADPTREGWSWDAEKRVATINVRSVSVATPVVVGIENAGSFADALALQKSLNLRAQIRDAKRVMKLRHCDIVGALGIKKPPRVIRVTEKIERQLTDIVDNPKQLAKSTPDFDALRKTVLDALTDQPFESDRTLPEVDPDSLKTMEGMHNPGFEPAQIDKITHLLRGPGLPAWLFPDERWSEPEGL